MRILILTPQLPYPPHQGTSLRNFHIIRGLAERHTITLLSFLEEGQSAAPETAAPLLALCAVHTVPVPVRRWGQRLWQLVSSSMPDMAHRLASAAFGGALRRLLAENQFDVVQVEGIELARYIEVIRAASPGSKVVFDDHNAETELQRRNFLTDLRQPRRRLAAAYSWTQIGRLRRFERWALAQADGIAAVSETDKRLLENLQSKIQNPKSKIVNRKSPIFVVPNCIDVDSYQTTPAAIIPHDLVFIGKMDYRPNVDAVLWFADEVWPLVQQERPSTTWAIVGQKPHPRLARLGDAAGINMTGWVDDVTPYLAGAAVVIAPFRVGSGTRLKLMEAMAAGKAIVSTPVGAEGFPVRSGRELLLAETGAEMGTAVLRLLSAPTERKRLGGAARQFAGKYDFRRVVPRFEALYTAVVVSMPHVVRTKT